MTTPPPATESASRPTADAADLASQYQPTEVESAMRARWDQARAWHAEPTDPGEPYAVVIPPPNVTAALHLGHALNNTLQDVLVRYHRMLGRNAMWMPGTDHAGIATQTVVEKRVLAEEGRRRTDFERDAFVRKIQAWKDQYERHITDQLKEMGCSCDWDRQRFTMDPQCAAAVREAFFRLFQDGLIYRGKRLVNWDPVTQTALADDEVEMREVDGHFWYMKYPVVDAEGAETGGFVTVATTRPETMLGDTAVAVNPADPVHATLIGCRVRLPIVGRIIPVIGDEYVVIPDPDSDDAKARMASGFLKVTPAHDPNDYEIGLRHRLPIINVMAPDGSISKDHGWLDFEACEAGAIAPLLGLSREDARRAVVRWFREHDLLADQRPYRHAVGHSYRSHVPIEPYYTDQWYVRVTDDRLAGAALRAMAEDQRQQSEGCTWKEGDSFRATSRQEGGGAVGPAAGRMKLHRRRLPHIEVGGGTYFVTFRLAKGQLSGAEREVVLDACRHWDGDRLDLHLVVVMPDHVHLLLTPRRRGGDTFWSLSDLMHSVRSFTADQINRSRGETGQLWQDEYFDRVIRDEVEFAEKWDHMFANPVRAGLVDHPDEYPFLVSGDSAVPADGGQDARPTAEEDACPTEGGESSDWQGKLRFYPDRYAKTFQSWHENIRDWCISRQLWWGHRIPVWSKGSLPIADSVDISGTGQISSEDIYAACDIRREFRDRLASQAQVDETARVIKAFICVRSEDDHEVIEYLEAAGFERDPDVLDTWFSSALWPLSTMGWPQVDGNEVLARWNPTQVLCTAREIITLWVSRMVMFNLYFHGRLPFHDVFIHAMIQDGHGQKMSKSLGNGVDPMDIIHSHGADAMRYTLTAMTTYTQDLRMPVDCIDPHTGRTFTPKFVTGAGGAKVAAPVQEHEGRSCVSSYGVATGAATPTEAMPLARNTSEKFDLGQRFSNKLWNAVRFALASLGEPADAVDEVAAGGLSPADRWILSRLARTVAAANGSLGEYQFAAYAQGLYDFIWRDLCDWYIEAVKPTVRQNRAQQQVLAACIDASLRLLHPVMPFITERLWEGLNRAWPRREVAGLKLPASELLMTARWPRVDAGLIDVEAERDFELIRSMVSAVRELRSTHGLPPRKVLEVTCRAPAAIAKKLLDSREITCSLAHVVGRGVGPRVEKPADAAVVVVGECELYVHGLVDQAAERERLGRRREELQRAVANFDRRLANESYVAKAPPKLVQETRDQRAEAVRELVAVEGELERMG